MPYLIRSPEKKKIQIKDLGAEYQELITIEMRRAVSLGLILLNQLG